MLCVKALLGDTKFSGYYQIVNVHKIFYLSQTLISVAPANEVGFVGVVSGGRVEA